MKDAGHFHVGAFRLHSEFSQRELHRLDALPISQPAGAIQHLAFRVHTDKSWREMALDVVPVFVVDRLPHQPLMLFATRSIRPGRMLGRPGAAREEDAHSYYRPEQTHKKF